MQTFRLAPMSTGVRVLTVLLLVLPAAMLVGALLGSRALVGPLVLVCLVYPWVWLRFRPAAFVITPGAVEVVWPLKRRQIPRAGIREVRVIDGPELRREVGWALRVGAGGLWGGFGWLWTRRRGIVQMYVSRADGMVWIERGTERPWLVTPERPDEFVRALSPGDQR